MKRSLTSLLIVAVALGVAVAPAVFAQSASPDFSGSWQLNATVYLPEVEDPCVYQGTVSLLQDGDTVNGPADLMLLSGPESCPGELTGSLFGTLTPSELAGVTDIAGTIDGTDPTGATTFTGSLGNGPLALAKGPGSGPAERARLGTKSLQGVGDLSVTQGSFSGASGTFSAFRLQFALDIPGLTPVGLTLLVLLLLGAGAFVLRGQQAA